MTVDNQAFSSTLPGPLLRSALNDPTAREVLADWLEEERGPRWATFVRERSPRWRDLKGVIRPHGLRLRNEDAGFHALPTSPPALAQDHLAWCVRRADTLDWLLDTPVWSEASRFHLTAWRARRALPDVVRRLTALRPEITVLELTGMAVDAAPLEGFPRLHTATLRLSAATRPATLSVEVLHLRVRSMADVALFARVRTPDLKTLTVSLIGERRFDADVDDAPAVHAAFERPMIRVALDSGVRAALAPVAAVASPGVRIDRRAPRPWDEDWRRWVVEG